MPLKIVLCLIVFLTLGCHSNTLQECRREARSIVLELSAEFHEVHTLEELIQKAPKLKKKMRQLTTLMIEAENYHRKHPKEQLQEETRLESDQLLYEMIRISEEIEGVKSILEELQSEMLDKLDVNDRKLRKL